MALKQQGQLRSLDGMEGMAGLVQQRAQVAVDADRVHEDQGQLPEWQRGAVTTGRLALAVVQVEEAGIIHGLVVAAEVGVDVGENRRRRIDQASDVVERLERGTARWIDRHIPWA